MEDEPSTKVSRGLRWPGVLILCIILALLAASRILWATTVSYYELIPLGVVALIYIGVKIWGKSSKNTDT